MENRQCGNYGLLKKLAVKGVVHDKGHVLHGGAAFAFYI
jgi:hypothetical protein